MKRLHITLSPLAKDICDVLAILGACLVALVILAASGEYIR